MLYYKHTRTTHEVLSTLMAKAIAIVNPRPLVPVFIDTEAPCFSSPAILLTQQAVDSNEDFKHPSVCEVYNIQWNVLLSLA